jgi:hypothetical protein
MATVMALIKKGADENWRDPQPYAKTPLNAAILGGRLDVVKVLLENGADINGADIFGCFASVGSGKPHRLSTIRNADHVMKKGRIVQRGSYEELM